VKNVGVQEIYTRRYIVLCSEAIQNGVVSQIKKEPCQAEALTVNFHWTSFCTALLKLASPPARKRACGKTSGIHSFRGRPTLRTNLEVAGCSEPGMKDISDNGLSGVERITLPRKTSCRSKSNMDAHFRLALSRTAAFEMRDMYEEGMRINFDNALS